MSCRPPFRIALLALLTTAASLFATIHPAAAPAATCAAASATSGVTRQVAMHSTLCLLNARRHRYGLQPLRYNVRLSQAARRHSRDMVRHRYFSHVSLSGTTFVTRIRRTGYLRRTHSWVVGENLAWGTGPGASPRWIVRAWMRSPGHRANILDPRFRDIGIGVVFAAPTPGRHPAVTYTTEFGKKP